jgi:arginyl-tRNA synthetase
MRSAIEELHRIVADITGETPQPGDWAPTPNRKLGDFAFPCFKIAKRLGKAPPLAAQEIAPQIRERLNAESLIAEVVPTGPYLNVFVAGERLFDRLATALAATPCRFGSNGSGDGQTLTLDFSSPNIAKEIGLHHLRSTGIGNALANIAALHGFRTVRINYLGDWGTSHGKNILALQRWGSEAELLKQGLPYILDLYVKFNQEQKKEEAEGRSDLTEAAKAAFKKLEDGDAEYRRVWALLREVSLAEFKKLYDRLGIAFDHYDGESLYEDRLDAVVDEVTRGIGTRVSEGALICELPGHKVPVLLKKDDGASLYITRDIAAAEDRFTRFHYDQSWYVVATQQKLHFTQLFDILKALGKPFAGCCEHVPFGMLSFGAKTMKSREGNLLFLKDVLDEAAKRARAIIEEKNPSLPNAAEVAEMIGQGAILFTDLSQQRSRDISFEWEKALSFEGDTGPFLQYTHARCCSLLEKGQAHAATLAAPNATAVADLGDLFAKDGPVHALTVELGLFETFAERALTERDPSQIATGMLNVAKAFGQLYHKVRFLDETSPARLAALLRATEATRDLLAHGLGLLGIRAPQAM